MTREMLITHHGTDLRASPGQGGRELRGAETAPEMEQMQHHLRTLSMHLGLVSSTIKAALALLCYRQSPGFVPRAGDFWLLWEVEPWLLCHRAPSKVWSPLIRLSPNIFGMPAINRCLPPAAMGWAMTEDSFPFLWHTQSGCP